jgi:3',5'-cyclic AMP phosphodiesterase CpdA
VISSQCGAYPTLAGDEQLHFLQAELARLAPARKAGERAVIIACHHPPASVDAGHGGGSGLADDIDSASRAAGFWPDAVLSGHAHLYQRFTRRVDGREIPYIVAGSGGFSATQPIGGLPATPVTVGEYTLDKPPIVDFGYLTVTVDMTGRDHHLTITFNDRTNTRLHDTTHLNLKTGKILAS